MLDLVQACQYTNYLDTYYGQASCVSRRKKKNCSPQLPNGQLLLCTQGLARQGMQRSGSGSITIGYPRENNRDGARHEDLWPPDYSETRRECCRRGQLARLHVCLSLSLSPMRQIELEIRQDVRIELEIKWDDRVVLGRLIRLIGSVDSGFYGLLSDSRPAHMAHWPCFYGSGQLADGSTRPVPVAEEDTMPWIHIPFEQPDIQSCILITNF